MITRVKARIRNWLAELVRREVRAALREMLPLVPQFIERAGAPEERRQVRRDHTKAPARHVALYAALAERLAAAGVTVERTRIEVAGFERWLTEFPELKRHYAAAGAACIEKCLEHYLVHRALRLESGATYIDVAAAGSPWAGILERRGVDAWRLDLGYAPGRQGRDIGADATRTGLPDAFADALSLQCAYECLQGDADVRLLPEVARLLKAGGRFAVAPLYVDDTTFVALDPCVDARTLDVEPKNAVRVWRDDGVPSAFARHYAPEDFAARVGRAAPAGLALRVQYIENLAEFMERWPEQVVYCFFVLVGEKGGEGVKREA